MSYWLRRLTKNCWWTFPLPGKFKPVINPGGVPLESKFCGDFPPKGVAILGDSAGAHFSIPPNWFRPSKFNKTTFDNFQMVIRNEFDWPMISWVTGMSDNCWTKGRSFIFCYIFE